jgi:secondary thiamine-phosphate synthase enzyme
MAVVGAFEDVNARTNGHVSGTNGHANGHTNGLVNGTSGASERQSGATATLTAPAPAAVVGMLPMRSITRVTQVYTEKHLEFVDITDEVVRCLAESGVQTGFAVVFSRHTTAGIRINEHEPLLLEDMARLIERMVPQDGEYQHDDFSIRTVNLTEGERINGHSHCRSLLLGASETIPVAGGKLLMGRWQRLFLVELDGPNTREFVIQIVGA